MRADPVMLAIEHVAWCARQDLTPRDVLASMVPTMPPIVTWETVIRELVELCEILARALRHHGLHPDLSAVQGRRAARPATRGVHMSEDFAADDDVSLSRIFSGPQHPASPPPLSNDDPMPPGPYKRDLTRYQGARLGRPWIIRAGNGQCIAGWIDSAAAAEAIVAALNAQFPVTR